MSRTKYHKGLFSVTGPPFCLLLAQWLTVQQLSSKLHIQRLVFRPRRTRAVICDATYCYRCRTVCLSVCLSAPVVSLECVNLGNSNLVSWLTLISTIAHMMDYPGAQRELRERSELFVSRQFFSNPISHSWNILINILPLSNISQLLGGYLEYVACVA